MKFVDDDDDDDDTERITWSRSASAGHKNLVNSIALKYWSDLNQNLHNYFHSQAKNWLYFQGHGFKGKGHRNVFQQRHSGISIDESLSTSIQFTDLFLVRYHVAD